MGYVSLFIKALNFEFLKLVDCCLRCSKNIYLHAFLSCGLLHRGLSFYLLPLIMQEMTEEENLELRAKTGPAGRSCSLISVDLSSRRRHQSTGSVGR